MNSKLKIKNSKLRAGPRRLLRRDDNPQQLIAFRNQSPHFRFRNRFKLTACCRDHIRQKLQPELSFVSFFFNDAQLGNEFRLRPCSARRSVICCDRAARPQQLPLHVVGFKPMRHRCAERKHINRKFPRSPLQVFSRHSKSIIGRPQECPSRTGSLSACPGNRKSTIENRKCL